MKCRGDPRGRPEFPNKGCPTFQPGALEWTRTTTPLGTGPQPAAYTIPPRGQISHNHNGLRKQFYIKLGALSIPFLLHFILTTDVLRPVKTAFCSLSVPVVSSTMMVMAPVRPVRSRTSTMRTTQVTFSPIRRRRI